MTIFEQVGGAPTFRRLVDSFYQKVEADLELRALFPANLEPGKEAQYYFLMQYFGGPGTYSEKRGHPRLRARHLPFTIGQKERDLWLQYMLEALAELAIAEPARTEMEEYFRRASTFMINQVEEGHPSLRIVGNNNQ